MLVIWISSSHLWAFSSVTVQRRREHKVSSDLMTRRRKFKLPFAVVCRLTRHFQPPWNKYWPSPRPLDLSHNAALQPADTERPWLRGGQVEWINDTVTHHFLHNEGYQSGRSCAPSVPPTSAFDMDECWRLVPNNHVFKQRGAPGNRKLKFKG